MSESKCYHISPAGKLMGVRTLAEALTAVNGGGFLWLDYNQPTKEELSTLIDPFGLHPLSIEDCFGNDQVPKIEDYPRNTFIIFNAFKYANGRLSIDEVDLFIGDNFLVTVTRSDSNHERPFKGIEQIVERDIEGARKGPS